MYVLIAEVIPFYGLNVPLDKDYLELCVRGLQRKVLPYHIKKRIIIFLIAVTYHRTILELKVTMKFVPVFFLTSIFAASHLSFTSFCFVLYDSSHPLQHCGE